MNLKKKEGPSGDASILLRRGNNKIVTRGRGRERLGWERGGGEKKWGKIRYGRKPRGPKE